MGLFGKKHSIGKTIAELRKAKGWTQVELAEKLQVSDKAISKWEKDNGSPSVEFFPILAELFGVSIDYIMTGKETEKEIVAMSKIELCAKRDDVKLFNSLSEEVIGSKDDNGKRLINYLLQYRCPKVVDALLTKYPAKTILASSGSRYSLFVYWDEYLLELLIRYNRIKELEELGVFSTIFYGTIRRTKEGNNAPNIYTANYRKIILTDENISDELKVRYFKGCTANEITDCLSDLLDLNDKKQINVLWKYVKEINQKSIAGYEKQKSETYSGDQIYIRYTNIPGKEYEPIGTSCNYYFFVVALSIQLLEKLLDKGYVEIARQANEFNAKIGSAVLNEEKFLLAEGKVSGKMSEKELTTLTVIKNGIVDIDALLQIKDYKRVKEILSKNPVHTVELMCNWLKVGKMKELFRYAVDHNLNALADYAKKADKERIQAELVEMFKKNLTVAEGYPIVSGKVVKIKQFNRYKKIEIEEIIQFFADYKQQILTNLSFELDKQKTIGDLTKEYFEKELKKENYEIVIVKLCVRLEAILRCDYHYEGDFSEMLNAFCNRINDSYASKMLNKLRMHRNSIVHSEKESEQLSIDELKVCIDYICKLG